MGIFGSLFRNKVGMPAKSEILNNHVAVYKKIIDDKNSMAQKALADLQNSSQWQTVLMKKERLDNSFSKGTVSDEEWIYLNNQLEELKLRIMANYIDEQNSDTIYGILKDSLVNLKKRYISLPNIDKMEFDCWLHIVDSAELAEITISQIVNSVEYVQSTKDDKTIREYQVRRYFRR